MTTGGASVELEFVKSVLANDEERRRTRSDSSNSMHRGERLPWIRATSKDE